MVAVFDFNNYMGSDGQVIRYRIDKEQPMTVPAVSPSSGTSVGFWGDSATPFLQSLIGKGRLVVEASPYQRGATEAIFPLKGYDAAIKRVRKACNW